MERPADESLADELSKLRRRSERDRAARLQAEAIAERGLRDLYEKKKQIELLGAIAVAANQSSNLNDALQFTLQHVCENTGWPLAHAYLCTTNQEQQSLFSSNLWHDLTGGSFQAFRNATESMIFATEVGLPGRVLSTGQPVWIEDLLNDPNFPRAESAHRCGIRSGFALPVMAGNRVAAVLEFFSLIQRAPDDFFLRLASQIGTQLGRVVERKLAEEQLMHDASHDQLTQLPNRTLFLDRLTRAIATTKRRQNATFAVLFVDLDRFKLINDSLGHNVGDELIIQVAQRMQHALRDSDLLSRCALPLTDSLEILARLGGDEFTILLEDIHLQSDASDVADRLQAVLTAPFSIGGRELSISASIGIAWSGSGYSSATDVMRDADLAMYRAKSQGKARYEVFDASLHRLAVVRLDMEINLRRALEQDEFVLHYQPIVSLRSQQIIGFEALVRWQKPYGHIVSPDNFIGIAEDTGLIIPIGNWVIVEACRQMRKWHAAFPHLKHLSISVNLSIRQFAQADLVESIVSILRETGLDPTCLRMEITESISIGDPTRALSVLAQLQQIGIKFSLDDFGTGYSSLSYLHRLPLQVLKIDRSFVSRMGHDQESLSIIRTIISLAHVLGLKIVAEGAETSAHVEQLTALGCDFAQGYFYSRPVNATQATRLLELPPWTETSDGEQVDLESQLSIG